MHPFAKGPTYPHTISTHTHTTHTNTHTHTHTHVYHPNTPLGTHTSPHSLPGEPTSCDHVSRSRPRPPWPPPPLTTTRYNFTEYLCSERCNLQTLSPAIAECGLWKLIGVNGAFVFRVSMVYWCATFRRSGAWSGVASRRCGRRYDMGMGGVWGLTGLPRPLGARSRSIELEG